MIATAVNPYLKDNFAPIQTETTVNNLPVIGELPSDLCGTFIRNGPNPKFSPLGRHSWFDGDGMLHGIHMSNGKALYRNRYVHTRGFEIEQAANRALWAGLLEPPQLANPANNLFGPFKNTANTALVWHADRLLALWEGGEPYEIDRSQLTTAGPFTYGGQLASPFTAHPKVDAKTGEMMFFGYSLLQPPYLKYSVVSPQGKIVSTVPIHLPAAVMMHDFAITENYTIFMDLPLTFKLERLRRREPAYLFEPEAPARFGILPRHGDGSRIQWFEVPSCYVVHTLNAYEDDDDVVLIACRNSDARALDVQTKGGMRSRQHDKPVLYRWRFNLYTGTVQAEILDDVASEFPSLNPQVLGSQNRYGYTAKIASGQVPLMTFDGLLKYDFFTGSRQLHPFRAGCYGGEAVFVPRTGGRQEDDGWLLTFVYDATQDSSELIVIDAKNFTDEPVARILLPQRVPYGFHGIWISEADLATTLKGSGKHYGE
ncbi:MAG: carotenoid oxygenase family protein [Cyanobacteria bacterium P01_A01_bin.114]